MQSAFQTCNKDFEGAKQDNGESVSVDPANFVEEDDVLHHQRNFLPTHYKKTKVFLLRFMIVDVKNDTFDYDPLQ
jgi:hypothetical protein